MDIGKKHSRETIARLEIGIESCNGHWRVQQCNHPHLCFMFEVTPLVIILQYVPIIHLHRSKMAMA
jgi:hypothetical protein